MKVKTVSFSGEINFLLFSVNSGMHAVIANILQLF